MSYLKHAGDWAYGVDLGAGASGNWTAQEMAVLQQLAQSHRNENLSAVINRLPEFKRKRPGGLTEKQIEWCRANLRSFMPKVLP